MPYALFPTPLGRIGVAWREGQLTRIYLPDALPPDPPAAAPSWLRPIGRALAQHLAGEPQSFAGLPLDWSKTPEFHRRVYDVARAVEAGRTISYAELAALAGSPRASRAVGQAMAKNPFPIVVPCHRVLAADGRAGGFSAPGGARTKQRLLACEGVHLTLPNAARRRGYAFDPVEASEALATADPALAALMAQVGPFALRTERLGSLFGALLRSIVFQQLSGKAASTIHGRVAALFPGGEPEAKAMADLPDHALRGAGLSANKLLSLRDLAARTLNGEVPSLTEIDRLSDAEIVRRLTVVRGIGEWTVQMLLIFRLGRPDVWPSSDLGIQKGFQRLRSMRSPPKPRALARHGERFRPYRSVAAWYLWRALELPRA